ncbi:helix-turn-helix domain-containing protein [Cuniculiplasma sp. SKW4]|uniref:helix-turn-helix domain-containing protein n=1 Tax=Cuniculiplasma sp. SKW4 TaxID=3400171 RepID=UPI003FD3C0B1
MDEITIESQNEMLFNRLSRKFPEVKFYRWCNSTVDFLEFILDSSDNETLKNSLQEAINEVGSKLISYSLNENRLSVMMSCKCSVNNSTIRIVESESCMWKAPVSYYEGREKITIYSPDAHCSKRVFEKISSRGPAEIIEKKPMRVEGFVNSFNISLEDIFGGLTKKQMDSMIKAIESGYFVFPRKVHLENIAKAMNLSRSTYQEHLSVALERVMTRIGPLLSLYSSTVNIREGEQG